MLTVGSLFTGIGGFDLGLERAGMRVLWQCEIDPFAQRVLEKHWPDVLRVPDIRELGTGTIPSVDVLAAGWPCPGFSVVGRGEGFDHAGSGLWTEIIRLVPDLRPRYVVLENVAALLGRGLGRVLGDLAAVGYDAEWDCIPASAVGAPHRRDRIWLVAYPGGPRRRQDARGAHGNEAAHEGRTPEHDHVADGHGQGDRARHAPHPESNGRRQGFEDPRGSLARDGAREELRPWHGCGDLAYADRESLVRPSVAWCERGPWRVEPDVGRVAHGVPQRVDRLRSLGNALVPQIAEWIGRRIVAYEEGRLAA